MLLLKLQMCKFFYETVSLAGPLLSSESPEFDIQHTSVSDIWNKLNDKFKIDTAPRLCKKISSLS